MMYLRDLHFSLRGEKEHRDLRLFNNPQITGPWSDDTLGCRYLLYKQDVSKSCAGGLKHREILPKVVCAYDNPHNPSKCYVTLIEKYKKLCSPPDAQKMDAFYYSPLAKPKADRWFSNVAIGHNTLQAIIKQLCWNAGIKGKRTNHSLRATSATRLYIANVDEQLICKQTGHRSESVRTYKRKSEDQKLLVSDIIFGGRKQKKSVTATSTRPFSDDATAPSSVATATAIPSSAAPPPAVSSEIVSDHDLREKTKENASRNICVTFNFS